jgi:CRISP-associated protein Cas1
MSTLYVTEPGARIEKNYQRIVVTNADDERLMSVPLAQLSEVVLVGSVGVTTQALTAILNNGIGFSIITSAGKLLGRLRPEISKNIILRHRQYAFTQNPELCLGIAKAIVKGKLHNQRALARRLCRSHPEIDDSSIDKFSNSLSRVSSASEMDLLRGLEGRAAKVYFNILRQSLTSGWLFEKRTRRPPGDPFNALLSLGYTLLVNNMMTALEVVGLDPYDGFFHADAYGRPSLALDLEEEFRTVIVDAAVLLIVNKRILKIEDFQPGEEGKMYLKPPAMKKFLLQYNARLQTKVIHPLVGHSLSYQKCFEIQAHQMRNVIEGKSAKYVPFLTR